MHKVSASYTLPTIMNTVKPAASGRALISGGTKASAAKGASSSTSSANSADGLGTTFLNLLSQELQNQDPTAPVDPTAMVGQMISLNQLEQLITINQTLSTSSSIGSTPGTVQGNTAPASGIAGTLANGSFSNSLSPSTLAPALNPLPFDPNTMMPLTSGNTGAVASSIHPSINAANMGIFGTNNNTSGGK